MVSGQNVRGEFCYRGDTPERESARQRAAYELGAKEEAIHRESAGCGRGLIRITY